MAQYGANKANVYNANKWTFEASEEVKAQSGEVRVIKEPVKKIEAKVEPKKA